MSTFSELGISFPLFQADAAEATEYRGPGECCICQRLKKHTFELGIGCALAIKCERCGSENGLDADDRADGNCYSCSAGIRFPLNPEIETRICYGCLRSGSAFITQDTALGMISWEQARTGITHGLPGLRSADFELVPLQDDWIGAKVPVEWMLELLRTPTYLTIQGENWQFCCARPMVYLGAWSRDEFQRRAPDGDGAAYFRSIVQDDIQGLWEDQLHDETGVYVFICPECKRKTAHWDLA